MLGSSDFWREDCAIAGRTRVKVQDECGKALEQSHWFKVQDACGKALGQSSWLKVQDECGKALEQSLWLKVQDLANKPPGALRGGGRFWRARCGAPSGQGFPRVIVTSLQGVSAGERFWRRRCGPPPCPGLPAGDCWQQSPEQSPGRLGAICTRSPHKPVG